MLQILFETNIQLTKTLQFLFHFIMALSGLTMHCSIVYLQSFLILSQFLPEFCIFQCFRVYPKHAHYAI